MSEIKKVIFFWSNVFNKNHYERYRIDNLKENGFEVEIWNFFPYLYPEVYKKMEKDLENNFENYYLFNKVEDIINAISKLSNQCLIISLNAYLCETLPIFKKLIKKKIKYSIFMANTGPELHDVKKPIINYCYSKLKKLFYKKFFPFYDGIRSADFILAGGTKSIIYNYKKGKNTKTLWLHHLDYDFYLLEKGKNDKFEKKTAVFLDENWVFSHDWDFYGVPVQITVEEYYPYVCKFFDYLEKKFDIQVVIAAHPNSDTEKIVHLLGNREIFKGQTAELVRKSYFTITSSSTSVKYSVLFNKPCIFFTTDSLQRCVWGEFVDYMPSLFGKKIININTDYSIDLNKELLIDEKVYRKFKKEYIKKDNTEELPFWEIFKKYVN